MKEEIEHLVTFPFTSMGLILLVKNADFIIKNSDPANRIVRKKCNFVSQIAHGTPVSCPGNAVSCEVSRGKIYGMRFALKINGERKPMKPGMFYDVPMHKMQQNMGLWKP